MKTKISSYFLFLAGFFSLFFCSLVFLQAKTTLVLEFISLKTNGPAAVAVNIYENLSIAEDGSGGSLAGGRGYEGFSSSDNGGGCCFLAALNPANQTETGGKGTTLSAPNSTPKEHARLSKEEQQKRATEVFHRIFKLSRSKERVGNLKQMIALYNQIINHCPDVPLAQESYWRLIEVFFRDFKPPKKDQALTLYKEYRNRYPDSPLRRAVKGTMTRSLYLNKYWKELLVFTSVCAEYFDDPKRLKSPLSLFYYSEAKFHLNDFKEAFRGYEVIVNYFPDSRMARTAKKRIAEIKEKKNKSTQKHLLTGGQR